MNEKKAIIVGGSNGIGLAIAKEFISRGFQAVILDKEEPDESLLHMRGKYEFNKCNLLNFSDDVFKEYAKDDSIKALMITAGFGRISNFEFLHPKEIENLFRVNTEACLKIISLFYDRIKSENTFLCGIMGSIAGLVSSPMFSVYAASKAAICRFVESVNIELEVSGTKNRILNVSPGSIKGTKFNGAKENDSKYTQTLAQDIVCRLNNQETLYIPEYDQTYKGVLERYHNDPHDFGLSSYDYKCKSGRVNNEKRLIIGYLSGTFDLFHVGHLNLLQRAKERCDYLIVGVHPDASHKGKETFLPFDERLRIVSSIRFVDKAVMSCKEDSDAWYLWHYNKLFVGSDYKGTERFCKYEEYFKDKNVVIEYFPYTAGTSSTKLREALSGLAKNT